MLAQFVSLLRIYPVTHLQASFWKVLKSQHKTRSAKQATFLALKLLDIIASFGWGIYDQRR